MPTFPNGTGPALATKSTVYDAATNTSAHWNGADANNHKTILSAAKAILAGSYRGYAHRRSASTLTAVQVHTGIVFVDGYRKTFASGRVLIPGATGTVYVIVRANPTGVAAVVRTAAAEPTPYPTATRDFPLARVDITGGAMTVTPIRPDWVLGWGR
jgi:hypothetical protein